MKIERWRVRELHPVDLSPEAVAARLRDLSQLDRLVRSLRTIRVPPGDRSGPSGEQRWDP